MALDILRVAGAAERIAPLEPRLAPLFCFALLTAACALASLALACATPFAAFAVIAAVMLPLPVALTVAAAAWVINQSIGFGLLHYPHDLKTALWGLAIGAAALMATVTARLVLRTLPRATLPLALGVALLAAYATYEIVLFAAAPFLGGAGAFTLAIVGRLGLLNIVWLIGLVAACAIGRLLGVALDRRTAAARI